jgi:HK97 family phage prohead protease
MNRAYSVIEVKAVDDGKRIFRGWATTPETDRSGDIINPLGATFKNPLVLLHQHDSDRPIGTVKFKAPTKAGIEFEAEIPQIDEPGPLKDRVDTAWGEIKSGLVRAVSIGFRAIKYAWMDNGGIDFQEIEIYELSAVSIPANAGAVITDVKSIKKFDKGVPAATGTMAHPTNATSPASGIKIKSIPIRPQEGQKTMKIKNVGAQIAALEEQRKAKADAMEAIQAKSSAEGRTKNADERKEFDDLRAELASLDAEISDLKSIEAIYTPGAKAVEPGNDPAPKPYQRMTPAVKPAGEKGLAFARVAKVKAVSRIDGMTRAEVAEKMYGKDSETYHIIKANEVAPGTNLAGNWAADLVSSEGAAAADFAEFLRPSTILGKFGVNGVPPLRPIPFRKPLVIGTGGGAGYWVGEAKPKPMTAFDFDRSTLDPLKCATIAVLSMENIRDSSPASDGIVRDELRRVLVALQDSAFIDPTNAGTATVKPASVLYGAAAIAAEAYSDESDVILDVRSLLQKFIDANNPASQAVLIMQEGTALAASLILNALGQRAFPDLTMRGGSLLGIPVITSESVPDGIVGIVNASDIFIGDDGDITVDMSTEASLEMKSVPTQDPTAPGTGAALVSLWQNNLVGFRAERTVNWKRRRASAAAYLTGVAWGGAVNVS